MSTESNVTRSGLIARNAVLNFAGQGLPLVVGVVTIPFTLRGLGVDRYGLLSFVWVILGYFAIFDLGLGRATTKYVAEALGANNEEKVPELVGTAVTVQLLLGTLGAISVASITPLLVNRILTIPPALRGEAASIFYLLAVSIPVVLTASSFSGILEAAQRFDFVNAVKIPSNLLIFALPAVGLLLGFHLVGIVGLMLLSRLLSCVTLLVLDFKVFPSLKKVRPSLVLFRTLFAYGGWVTVSSVIGPILVYLDRFLIGSILSVSALAYYTTPYEAVTRLGIIPASLAMTLFPTFSALEGVGERDRLGRIFARSVKYIVLALAPIVLVVVLFAQDVLRLWLGSDFAMQSAPVLKILAIGVLFNALGQVPYALVQGVGRPDVTAKFHAVELLFYVGIAWLFITKWGIYGAAAAWTLRVAVDTTLLFLASFKVCGLSPRLFATARGLMLSCTGILLVASASVGLKQLAAGLPLLIQSILFIPVFGLSALLVWTTVLDASDRLALVKVIKL